MASESSKARGHRSKGALERQRPQIDDNNYQMFSGRHTATAKSTRNHRFQLQSMRRPTSHTQKQRFEHLTPRQRQRKRQELIDRFKSNVATFIGSAGAALAQGELDSRQPASKETVGALLHQSLNETDAFLQRKQQKRRTLRDPNTGPLSVGKFREKKVLYRRGEEQLWDLLNRVEQLRDLKRQKDEHNYMQEQRRAFQDRLAGQMKEAEVAKSQKKMKAQAESMEMKKFAYEFEEDDRAQRQHEEAKRLQLY